MFLTSYQCYNVCLVSGVKRRMGSLHRTTELHFGRLHFVLLEQVVSWSYHI